MDQQQFREKYFPKIMHNVCKVVKSPWIFPSAPLMFNRAPGNIQDNLDKYVFALCYGWLQTYLAIFSGVTSQALEPVGRGQWCDAEKYE